MKIVIISFICILIFGIMIDEERWDRWAKEHDPVINEYIDNYIGEPYSAKRVLIVFAISGLLFIFIMNKVYSGNIIPKG
jgi:hypothetical protein